MSDRVDEDPRRVGATAAVVVASTSAAAGLAEDRTGPVIRAWLEDRGFAVAEPLVVADGPPVGEALHRELDAGRRVILTTGGTGVGPGDSTPEQTAPLLDVQLPGIAEEIRRLGRATTATALLTRGVAGFAGGALVVNLPGSPGGVADGLAVLDPLLDHLLAQRADGSGHARRGTSGNAP